MAARGAQPGRGGVLGAARNCRAARRRRRRDRGALRNPRQRTPHVAGAPLPDGGAAAVAAPAQRMSPRLPALFLGHGNPLNALQANPWTRAWSALGAALPQPRAVLSISAHWYVPATAVTAMARPRTIHDFGGFRASCLRRAIPRPEIQ